MQKDFHYNLTLALAKVAGIGLDIAFDIAWANQFVDDCKDYNKYGFRTMVDIIRNATDSLVPEVQRSVFVPFHCLPGSKDSLVAKPDSELAEILINNAIKVGDPIALGIALHSFQDTYSHQGFTGTQSENNAKHKWTLTSIIAPKVIHAEFGLDPDIIGNTWTGFSGLIDNNIRFQEAADRTLNYLSCFAGFMTYKKCDIELYDFWNLLSYDHRKRWILNWAGIPDIYTYSKINSGISEEKIKRFVAAAKKQQAIVFEYLS